MSENKKNLALVLAARAIDAAKGAAMPGSACCAGIATEISQELVRYFEEEIVKATKMLATRRLWWVSTAADANVMILDGKSRLLWDAKPAANASHKGAAAKTEVEKTSIANIRGWRLPTNAELRSFVESQDNPLRSGQNYRLLQTFGWWTSAGRLDLDDFKVCDESFSGAIIGCNDFLSDAGSEELIRTAVELGWSLRACGVQGGPDIVAAFGTGSWLKDFYHDVDFQSARLPKLDPAQFTDHNKGLWELWGMDADWLAQQNICARDPASDVRNWNVAIDFGTNSTVVAYDENDLHKLLRVGVGDYWEKEQPEHYENPTALEFIDIPGLLSHWQTVAYRPRVQWDQHFRGAHAALQSLRDNKSEPRVVASVLAKIKQWALREGRDARLRLTDRTEPRGTELELAPLTQREPVKGQPLAVSALDPLDPVELYAWLLGLHINWRGRGIFLRYYMTFPIAYPRDVKDRILASFRRGLQRSLPATLIEQPLFQHFTVEERGSEPAAYAACAMSVLGIQPTREGVAYAVFDFGGGTADFDFGYYRLPDADEEDEGKEEVFEHFGAAGDRFLGGENLLENMAYLVFRHNVDVCREKKIGFTRPLDADDFAGSEMFLEQTQAASTNTIMLMARLRPLWETGTLQSSSGIETIDLNTRDGRKVQCQLVVPVDTLTTYLQQRIEAGVRSFFAAMKNAFAQQMPAQIHVLLAGNASRSQWVARCFGLPPDPEVDASVEDRVRGYMYTLFGDQAPSLIMYGPLPGDPGNVYSPTAKTGVALGLLRLCPGGSVKVVDRVHDATDGEAPFAHHVGRIKQGAFQAGIAQGSAYRVWHELGVPSERVFNLYHTQLPRARDGGVQQGEPGLYKKRLDLASEVRGHKVFAQAIGPSEIELCTAASADAIAQGDFDNVLTVALDG